MQVCEFKYASVWRCEDASMRVCGSKYVSVWRCEDASMQVCEATVGLADSGRPGKDSPRRHHGNTAPAG